MVAAGLPKVEVPRPKVEAGAEVPKAEVAPKAGAAQQRRCMFILLHRHRMGCG